MRPRCPVCRKPLPWFDRISHASTCKDCFKAGATIKPPAILEDSTLPMDDGEVIQVLCRERFSERISFSSVYSKELSRKAWPFGTFHVVAILPFLLILLLLSAFFSLSEKVFWVSLAIWYANLLLIFLINRLHQILGARYLRKVNGTEEWTCEIAKDTVTAKNIGYHSVFLNRHLTRIEDCSEFVILYFGNFGRVRIPLPDGDSETDRRLLVRKITKRLQPASVR